MSLVFTSCIILYESGSKNTESMKSCHGIFGVEVNKVIDIRNRNKTVEVSKIGFDFGALFAGERA